MAEGTFLQPLGGGSCCACDSATICDCCGTDTKSYYEVHGFTECPNVGEKCNPGTTKPPSCVGATITKVLESKDFPEECFEPPKKPMAAFSLWADNYGYVQGQDKKQCDNFGGDECTTCSFSDKVTATVLPGTKLNTKKMQVVTYAANAPHGGPYGLSVTVNFYFE